MKFIVLHTHKFRELYLQHLQGKWSHMCLSPSISLLFSLAPPPSHFHCIKIHWLCIQRLSVSLYGCVHFAFCLLSPLYSLLWRIYPLLALPHSPHLPTAYLSTCVLPVFVCELRSIHTHTHLAFVLLSANSIERRIVKCSGRPEGIFELAQSTWIVVLVVDAQISAECLWAACSQC